MGNLMTNNHEKHIGKSWRLIPSILEHIEYRINQLRKQNWDYNICQLTGKLLPHPIQRAFGRNRARMWGGGASLGNFLYLPWCVLVFLGIVMISSGCNECFNFLLCVSSFRLSKSSRLVSPILENLGDS